MTEFAPGPTPGTARPAVTWEADPKVIQAVARGDDLIVNGTLYRRVAGNG